jgi:hypothetical protein
VRDPSFAQAGETEQAEEGLFVYPSVARRFLFFLIWWLAIVILLDEPARGILSLFIGGLKADSFLRSIKRLTDVLDSLVLVFVASLAAAGRLPGAKRRRKLPEG